MKQVSLKKMLGIETTAKLIKGEIQSKCQFIHCKKLLLCLSSPVDGHLACFRFLVAVNNAANLSMSLLSLYGHLLSLPLSEYLEMYLWIP